MKIIRTSQIRELDAYTIENEPIPSIELMERAASAVANRLMQLWTPQSPFIFFAGPGNNGGDALAAARIMSQAGYNVTAYLFNTGNKLSEDCRINKQRLAECSSLRFNEVTTRFDPPKISTDYIIVDGLFGTGLNRPLDRGFGALVKFINQAGAHVVSIDIPSGLLCEQEFDFNTCDIVKADLTLTMQVTKLNFLLPDAQPYIGRLEIMNIGLLTQHIDSMQTPYHLTEHNDISQMLHKRPCFAHKGTFGHALLIAGCEDMAGASILAAKACLRSGCGVLTVHGPKANRIPVQTAIPEAIYQSDSETGFVTDTVPTRKYTAIAIGPGLGQNSITARSFVEQITHTNIPTIIDADGLNILADHKNWMSYVHPDTIITPHPGEMMRLCGRPIESSYRLLTEAVNLAINRQIYVVLKGHYTAICTPQGSVHFNPTGNAGMATAGSGDVLTGIMLSLLAQGYTPLQACQLGVYLHGLAGDLAARELGEESMIASDIIRHLPDAFNSLKHNDSADI